MLSMQSNRRWTTLSYSLAIALNLLMLMLMLNVRSVSKWIYEKNN
jgi:hypothetical protein